MPTDVPAVSLYSRSGSQGDERLIAAGPSRSGCDMVHAEHHVVGQAPTRVNQSDPAGIQPKVRRPQFGGARGMARLPGSTPVIRLGYRVIRDRPRAVPEPNR
ncbi:hypothetical protein [Actinocrispum sp. NPDC049592]|uniref:hypothetical protein n=1 Tax=Actinocrispum sp. NPDC049592 TaxID=3154835 RepID=UPI00342ECA63